MVVRSTSVGTAPVEDMQALSITTLSASEVEQQYELIGPLGKGTYGRVDLVAHRTQGKCESPLFLLNFRPVLMSYISCMQWASSAWAPNYNSE